MDAPQIQVVGYDGSSLSERALRRAVEDAAQLEFAVLHVVSVVEDQGDKVRLPSGEVMSRWAALSSLRLTVDHLVKSWNVNPRFLSIKGHIRSGDVAQAIVDLGYRHHAERILVGSRGDSGQSWSKLGSVALGVMNLSDIPIHLESPMSGRAQAQPFNAVRFAFVIGGPLGSRGEPKRNFA